MDMRLSRYDNKYQARTRAERLTKFTEQARRGAEDAYAMVSARGGT